MDDLLELGDVNWRRPADIPDLVDDRRGKSRLRLFVGLIEPNDIIQGGIGDCYFLSSLAALSERPERIKELFCSEKVNEHGVYGANFYKNGIKMTVVVDDLIPCEGKGNEVAFARGNGPELWVVLLEKMWAKIHGCYDRIAGGLEYETIRDLCGAPGYFYYEVNEFTFDKILEFD